jgi:hypothetical protein
MTVREYERHVWDMARTQLHPSFLYVAAQVAGATRLLQHAWFSGPGAGWGEALLFAAGFLGAWACFYATLLRVAGLRAVTVTLLVPLAAAAALAIWFVLPAPEHMSRTTLLAASLALAGPGALAWPFAMRRWRAARREAAELLEAERPA